MSAGEPESGPTIESRPIESGVKPVPADHKHDSAGHERLQLISDLLVFQIKLAADGLRDLLLLPVSLIAAVIGLVRGGDDPAAPFRDVIRFGRRTEAWINLFGQHEGNTADALIEPLQKRLLHDIRNSPSIAQTVERINRKTQVPDGESPPPDGPATRKGSGDV